MVVVAADSSRQVPNSSGLATLSEWSPSDCHYWGSLIGAQDLTPSTEYSQQDSWKGAMESTIDPSLISIRNLTRDTQVASHVEVAGTNVKRSKGLLGRKGLDHGGGMWIIPCEAIHTFFMQFPIDLIYLDKKLRVKKVRSSVRAWRISACFSAHSVLELPAGTIRETRTQTGDLFELRDQAT